MPDVFQASSVIAQKVAEPGMVQQLPWAMLEQNGAQAEAMVKMWTQIRNHYRGEAWRRMDEEKVESKGNAKRVGRYETQRVWVNNVIFEEDDND